MDIGNLISGASAFSKSSLFIWKFLVHIMLKHNLKDIEHYLTSILNECNNLVVWTFFGINLSLELEWKLTFSSPVATAGSCRFADILNATPWWHHPSGIWIVLLEFHIFFNKYIKNICIGHYVRNSHWNGWPILS